MANKTWRPLSDVILIEKFSTSEIGFFPTLVRFIDHYIDGVGAQLVKVLTVIISQGADSIG